MNLYFPNFEDTTIISIPYKYDPLTLFINSIRHLKTTSSGESQISIVLNQCDLLLKKFISAKEIFNEDSTKTRDTCMTLRSYRPEISNTAKTIFNSIKFININTIIQECLEHLILNNSDNRYGLLVESTHQWDFIHSLLLERGLNEFVQPIFRKTAREQYFDFPIITFLPSTWIPELITLPPTKKFILIHPENFFMHGAQSSFFKAPNNKPIEITTENFQFSKDQSITITVCQEFYTKCPEYNSDLLISNFDKDPYINYDQPLLTVEFIDKSRKAQFIECNKEYLVISKDGKVRFSTFENEEQVQSIRYIVNNIDSSCLSSEDLRLKQNSIMEKWKKPLRDHPHIETLVKELEKKGAIKANITNVKHWYDPNRIAPGSHEDYKAVLSFAGITDKHEVDRFFEFAKKRRGDSISEGHDKRVIGQEIVREFLESIKHDDVLSSQYHVQGIQFSLIALG